MEGDALHDLPSWLLAILHGYEINVMPQRCELLREAPDHARTAAAQRRIFETGH